MYFAKTQINIDNKIYEIENDLIINFLRDKGLSVDESILKNPYFRYRLFTIFKIINNIINIKYCKGKIIVETDEYAYEIFENSSNGLTMIKSLYTCDGSNLFVKSCTIYELFPEKEGIALIEHSKCIVSCDYSYYCELSERLIISHISHNGFNNHKEILSNSISLDDKYSNINITLSALTLNEYNELLNKMRTNSNRKMIIRGSNINEINEIDEYGSKRKYFNHMNIFELIELDNYYSNKKDIDLPNDIYVDSVCYDLLSYISNRLDKKIKLIKYLVVDFDNAKILEQMSNKNKKLMYS